MKTIQARFQIAKMETPEMSESIYWCIDRINEYQIGVTIEGDFVDNATCKRIHDNHLKCLLRRDYLQNYPGEKQKNVVECCIKALKLLVKDPENEVAKQEINVLDDYI